MPAMANDDGARWQLHDAGGLRKYVTRAERAAFLDAAALADRRVRTLCLTLAWTGCRLSEALALTAGRIDLDAGTVVFESLKKRRGGIQRAVPVPPHVLDALDLVHGVREAQAQGRWQERLWPWSRTTAFRRVREVMEAAGVSGPQACAKGLRHGYGVAAVQAAVPLNLLQRWLGHSDMTTTAIYAAATGAEERAIAERMWET